MNDEEQEKFHEPLKEFKKKFDDLLAEYPHFTVGPNIHGELTAFHIDDYRIQIRLNNKHQYNKV